jgi:hypothetical protein
MYHIMSVVVNSHLILTAEYINIKLKPTIIYIYLQLTQQNSVKVHIYQVFMFLIIFLKQLKCWLRMREGLNLHSEGFYIATPFIL